MTTYKKYRVDSELIIGKRECHSCDSTKYKSWVSKHTLMYMHTRAHTTPRPRPMGLGDLTWADSASL